MTYPNKVNPAPPRKPVLLLILDGFGINPGKRHNAIALARTPRFDEYFDTHALTTLEASGRAVGLPEGQMGNSEVGHMTLGCGAIIAQDLVRIDDAITDGSFFKNAAISAALRHAKQRQRPVHLLGLVSDGGVHSHINHLYALIDCCAQHRVSPALHLFADGRDTPPKSILNFLPELEKRLHQANGRVMSICGRYYAMDRDRRWERTQLAWNALLHNQGRHAADARSAIEFAYANGETDEFILPTVLEGATSVAKDDAVILFNFRSDRSRQLTYLLTSAEFTPFERGDFRPLHVTCLTEYDERFHLPVAFAPKTPSTALGELVAKAGLHQFRCAETEKYPHVTFFFNGGRETPYPFEDRHMVPSPKVATYDLAPEMNATELGNRLVTALSSGKYGFILANFANGDMVGHTAVQDAVVKAVEALDREVGRVLDHAQACGYSIVLTADHGNCEQMIDPVTGAPHTQHTTFPVPCMVIDHEYKRLTTGGGLANIAATVLQLMGLPTPQTMKSSLVLKQ